MPILLWLLGIPIPLIIFIMLLHRGRKHHLRTSISVHSTPTEEVHRPRISPQPC